MNIKKKADHEKAIQLFLTGMSQKRIAELLGIAPKTVCVWIKNAPQVKARKTVTVLQDRLIKEARTMTPEQIVKLSDAISKLHKIATHTVQKP